MNRLLSLFSDLQVQRWGWVLLHFLWQGAVIALLLAVALRILTRASVHIRYLVIAGALLLCGMMPAATWIWLGQAVARPFSSETTTMSMANGWGEKVVAETKVGSIGQVGTGWPERLSHYAETALHYMVGIWLGGVLILTLRLTLGWAWLQRLRQSGTPIHQPDCLEKFHSLLERMQVGVPVQLGQSTLVEVPTLIGLLRPTILLPVSVFTGLTLDELEAILAHELAHVRRHDYLVNLIQVIIETILFYHPAVWWISRKLREERENCCDEMALEVTQDRLVYASALAHLEEGRMIPWALTASGGSLLHRIRRIVGGKDKKAAAWPLGMMVLFLIAVIGILLSATRADTPAVAVAPSANKPVSTSFSACDIKVTISLAGKLKDLSRPGIDKYEMNGVPTSHLDLCPISLKFGQQGVIKNILEFPYPVEFEEPKTGVFSPLDMPVPFAIPMTPRKFVVQELGWSISLTPVQGENGIVNLEGIATCTTASLIHNGAYGGNSSPIYTDIKNPQTGKVAHVLLSNNTSTMPIFQTSVTPFFVFAKPGHSYIVKFQAGADSIDATIRNNLLEDSRKSPTPKQPL